MATRQPPRLPLSDPRALRWWAPVSLPGDLRVTGRRLVTPTATHALSADEARVLLACDGVTPAKHLLHRLARTKAARATLRDVLLRLDGLGVLRWGFPVSLSLDPEAPFRAALARIRDMEARAQLAAPLEALCAARDAVAQAAGDATRLEPALAALESTFTAHTQRAATRHEGRTYGGRGLVFEEARRAVSLELSDAALTVIAPPLRVLLQVGRWYSFEVAQHLAKGLLRVFRRLGGRRVPLHVFWRATESLFDREVPPSVAHASKKLATRWAALWRDAEVRPDGVFLSAERAEALAQQRFAAPCPGWPGARHHAPDLMWSAPSAEAVLRGEGLPVLAELHPGVTPLSTLSVLSLCPVRTALETEWRRDFPPGLASPIPWEDFARSSQDARLAASHWHLDVGGDFASPRPARQTLRAADFDVVLRQGRLWAKHRSGGPTLDLLVVFERRIKLRAATAFSLGDGAPTGPRRLLGPLVVQRARWRFPAEALQSLQPTEGRAAAVLAWRAAHGIPERVFVRSPREVKPVYLDLLAPTSVEQLVRLARQAEWLAFSEMLPGPDGLWLRDDAGHTFVSEVRCVAVDPAPWDGALVWPSAPGR